MRRRTHAALYGVAALGLAFPGESPGPEAGDELAVADLLTAPTCVQSDGDLRCLMQLPERAQLRVRSRPPLSDSELRIRVVSDGLGESTLRHQRSGDTSWAELGDFAGRIARLVVENRSGRPVRWTAVELASADPVPPPVPSPAARPAARPNVLLYVIDTLRADRLSVYGYARPTTPRLEALARRGIAFDRAYSNGPKTRDSIPVLFASRYHSELGGHLQPRPEQPIVTLAELFQRAGYRTAAFQANYVLGEGFGYGRGFDVYRVFGRRDTGHPTESAAVLHEAAQAWLREQDDPPWFLFIQTMDVHNPYAPPPPFDGRFREADREPRLPPVSPEEAALELGLEPTPELLKRLGNLTRGLRRLDPDQYDACIAYADHELGSLLDALEGSGWGSDTVVAVTSDHGESLGDGDGRILHGYSLHEELVRIPLILSIPGQPGGQRSGAIVSLLDLAPTLAEIAGLEVPGSFRGRSLLRSRAPGSPPFAMGELSLSGRAVDRFIREGPWKLVVGRGRKDLFDVERDPTTETPLTDGFEVTRAYLESRLAQLARAMAQRSPAELTREQRQASEAALRALGYVE